MNIRAVVGYSCREQPTMLGHDADVHNVVLRRFYGRSQWSENWSVKPVHCVNGGSIPPAPTNERIINANNETGLNSNCCAGSEP